MWIMKDRIVGESNGSTSLGSVSRKESVVIEFVRMNVQAGKGASKHGRYPSSVGFVGTFDTCRLDRREGGRTVPEAHRCRLVDAED